MAASGVGRTFQVVKPHLPMIKFKGQGFGAGAKSSVKDNSKGKNILIKDKIHNKFTTNVPSGASQQMLPVPTVSPQTGTTSCNLASSYMKPVGNTPRGSGISDQDLPPKYRRKPIEEEEIAYILRGGPE